LSIDNTGAPGTLVLEDTVYVHGDLLFDQPASVHNYTIDLNGQTIFVEGAIMVKPQNIRISGSGCIIAAGDILFQPTIAIGEDDFMLVMSITGTVELKPKGTFTGCIVGAESVIVSPHTTPDWISPAGKGINFPMGESEGNEQSATDGVCNIES